MSEKLCLKWNDFQENVSIAFGSLREDDEFADVTLACEDGKQIEAHKVILASSSPFFKNLLRRNRNPHPLIYMRGVKSENLLAIVDFLYCGEANVDQENLESFLVIAEELQLKGLMGQTDDGEKRTENNCTNETSEQMNPKPFRKKEKLILTNEPNLDPNVKQEPPNVENNYEGSVSIPKFVSGDLQELEEKVKSMMENGQNISSNGRNRTRICKLCGKEGQAINIGDHIEAKHLDGVSLPCNICEKTFRTRASLRHHAASKHKSSVLM